MIKDLAKFILRVDNFKKERTHLIENLKKLQMERDALVSENSLLSVRENNYLIQLKKKGTPHQLYPNFSAALADCKTIDAYQNEELVKAIVFKQVELNKVGLPQPLEVPDAIWAALCGINYSFKKLKGNKLNVLDHGGSTGSHYFFLKYFLSENMNINWCVVETEKMVAHARCLETSNLSFVSSVEDAEKKLGHVDLFYSSGTLQCIPDPLEFLNTIAVKNWPFLLFNRTAFTSGDHAVISIQISRLKDNGISGALPAGVIDKEIQYPVSYVRFSDFENRLKDNYQLQWKCPIESGYHMVNEEPIFGNALFYERKN